MSAKEQVLAAAAKIVSDFGSHSKKEYFANFSAEATFIFHTHNTRLNSRAEYESLWESWESQDGFRVHGCKSTNQLVQLIGDGFAVFTHDVESQVEFGGETSTVLERETIVFSREQGNWVAVHEHLSPASDS